MVRSISDTPLYKDNSDKEKYRVIIVRNYLPEKVIKYAAERLNKKVSGINIKYTKDNNDFKALCAFLLRNLCDMKEKNICKVIGSITQSHVSKLCNAGYKLVCDNEEYGSIFKDLMNTRAL